MDVRATARGAVGASSQVPNSISTPAPHTSTTHTHTHTHTLTNALSFVHLSFHASNSYRGTVSMSASAEGAAAGASFAAGLGSTSFPCNAAVAADAAPQNELTMKLAVSSTFFTSSSFSTTPASAATVPTSPAGPARRALAAAVSSFAVARSASNRLILIFAFFAHSIRASRDSSCLAAGASLRAPRGGGGPGSRDGARRRGSQ
jgi:hypothetical protein